MCYHKLVLVVSLLLLMGACKGENRQPSSRSISSSEDRSSAVEPIAIEIPNYSRSLNQGHASASELPLFSDVSASPMVPSFSLPLPPPLIGGFRGDVADDDTPASKDCCCDEGCDFATAVFSGAPSDWYILNTNSYPDTVALSLHRNGGFTKGGVTLANSGVRVKSKGNYWVSFSATLQNSQLDDTPLIPVFLVRNNNFIPDDSGEMQLGGIVSLPPNLISVVQGSGVLKDVDSGTLLSLVATNGGSPQPEPITVVSWNISLHKICD